MPTPLHALILEDSPADAELLLHELRRAGFEPHGQRVATEPDFLAGLTPPPDIILADYTLPQFDALRALRCVQERAQDVPLIVVTGALSDEAAVACLKQGAADYLLKDRLGRLGEAVRHTLAEQDLRVQHRQAHDALRASEERFRALSEHASDLVGILDADGTYRYASPSHRRILGYAPAEVQGRNVFELMHPDDVPHTQAAFAALLQRVGAMEAAEFRMRHADGSWRTLEGTGTNRLHDPAVHGIIVNARDITERKQAEEERGVLLAREQEARQAAETATARLQALQSVTDAALAHPALEDLLPRVLDRITTALAVDNAAILLLSEDGENLELLMARGPEEQVAGQVRVPVGHGIAGHIAATRAPLIVDDLATVEVVNPFLREAIRSLMGVPLVVENRVIGVVHVGTRAPRHFTADDKHLLQLVADRIALAIGHAHLYTAEREAHARAVKAVQERDEFLSVAAHELKTPVTSLCGFAQTLLRLMKGETRIEAPQVRRALQHIDTQSMKLDGLIAQLLDLSRIEAGRLSLNCEVVDLTAVVQGVVAAAQARTNAHTLVVHAPAPIAARLDPLRIEQVLVNLVNNAIKYSPDEGPIDIAATQHGEVAQVTVRDHGLGIPPEHREHIFDRFYQAHARSHRSGMGLGLYISRQIVDLHGGSITADFPADGGTRFVVTLPTHESDK